MTRGDDKGGSVLLWGWQQQLPLSAKIAAVVCWPVVTLGSLLESKGCCRFSGVEISQTAA